MPPFLVVSASLGGALTRVGRRSSRQWPSGCVTLENAGHPIHGSATNSVHIRCRIRRVQPTSVAKPTGGEIVPGVSLTARAPRSVPAGDRATSEADLKRRGVLVAVTAVGLTLAAVVAYTSATGWDQNQPLVSVVPRVAGVLAFFAVGGWCLERRPGDRFGWLMVGLGTAYALTMLNGSSNSTLYSIGRAALPFSEAAVAYTALAFPSGRLTARRDRYLVGAFAVATVVLWLPALLLSEQFTVGGVLVECGDACPANAFVVHDAATPARALSNGLYLVAFGVLVGVVASLTARYRSGRPVLRRSLAPVTITAALRGGSVAAYIVGRAVAPESHATQVFGWVAVIAVIAIPLSFLAGVIRARLFSISVLHTLILELNSTASPPQFRQALSRALGDPDLELVTPTVDGGLLDLAGNRLERPLPGASQMVTSIDGASHGLAILHDTALIEDQEFFDAVRAAVAVEVEQEAQRRRVQALLDELASSRSRVAVARDEERRGIERDLHDGAQQQLVAVRVQLGIVQSALDRDAAAGSMLLADVAQDLDAAISQLRDLARGIYPPVLESEGLAEALGVAARSATLPTTVTADPLGPIPRPVEHAAYFCCLEAMHNADRHAGGTARILVHLTRTADALEFSVADTGDGFEVGAQTEGAGLVNMRDRVESAGGSLQIESTSQGSRVMGRVPRGSSA